MYIQQIIFRTISTLFCVLCFQKASIDEEIATLRRIYRHHIEETMRKNKQTKLENEQF